jgi:integral membrane sensor domain MASE1
MVRHVELLAGKLLPTTILIAALATGSAVAPFGAKLEACNLTRTVAEPVQTVVIRLAGFAVEETRWVGHRLRKFTVFAVGGPIGLFCLTAHKRQKYDQNQTKRLAQKNRLEIT